jgi:hypothetical protein
VGAVECEKQQQRKSSNPVMLGSEPNLSLPISPVSIFLNLLVAVGNHAYMQLQPTVTFALGTMALPGVLPPRLFFPYFFMSSHAQNL